MLTECVIVYTVKMRCSVIFPKVYLVSCAYLHACVRYVYACVCVLRMGSHRAEVKKTHRIVTGSYKHRSLYVLCLRVQLFGMKLAGHSARPLQVGRMGHLEDN